MLLTDSKTFCLRPWNELRLGTNGSVGICSYSPDIGNSYNATMLEILNGPTITEIKLAIKNNEWHPNCAHCATNEKNRNSSPRTDALKFIDEYTKSHINNDQQILQHLSINWNNLCNLACNYCGPVQSSKWSEYKSLPVVVDKLDKGSALEYILANQQELLGILIGGGEPLLQKSIHQLLDNINLVNDKIHVAVTTNLSVSSLKKNPAFNTIINNPSLTVSWMISFDNLGDKFEYVRHGATWDIFCENINTLKEYNQVIVAHPAYNLYCAMDLVEYYKFCFDNKLAVYWCELFHPIELNLIYAPIAIKKLAIAEIDTILALYSDLPEGNHMSLDILGSYKDMINSNLTVEFDTQYAQQIKKFTSEIEDTLPKNHTFAQLWPNIQKILDELTP